MDASYREFERRMNSEFTPTAEIIRRRRRAGCCIVCGGNNTGRCGCVGVYLYRDENDGYRLRRDRRSTLPCGIITNILLEGEVEVLRFGVYKNRSSEIKVPIESIVDLELAIRGGVDVGDDEKRLLSSYLTALEHTSDLRATVDTEESAEWENDDD